MKHTDRVKQLNWALGVVDTARLDLNGKVVGTLPVLTANEYTRAMLILAREVKGRLTWVEQHELRSMTFLRGYRESRASLPTY